MTLNDMIRIDEHGQVTTKVTNFIPHVSIEDAKGFKDDMVTHANKTSIIIKELSDLEFVEARKDVEDILERYSNIMIASAEQLIELRLLVEKIQEERDLLLMDALKNREVDVPLAG